MKTWIWTPLAAALVLFVTVPHVAVAGGNPDAVMALHIGTWTATNACDVILPSDCGSFTTDTASSGFFNVYLTVARTDSMGLAGLQFGIEYDGGTSAGCDISRWTACTDLEFSSSGWPGSGTGNLMTWEYSQNCQMDSTGQIPFVVGAFEIVAYSSDVFSIVPRPVDGKVKVADCSLAETDLTGLVPSRLGVVSFGLGTGYNPCSTLVPVRRTTWGKLKALFEN